MQHAHSSRGGAEAPSAAMRRKPRSRFRVGYARDAAEEEGDAPAAGTSAIHGNDVSRTSSPVVSSGPASETRHEESTSGAALDPIRTRDDHSTAAGRQQGTASPAALTGELTALQHLYDPVRMHEPMVSPATASAGQPSVASKAYEQAASAMDEAGHQLGLTAEAGPIGVTSGAGSVTAADGGASEHAEPSPAAEHKALSPVRLTAVASHGMNAFDAALGFGDAQLVAASVSMYESGLEGHSLPDKVVRVRQRLEMEQDRLASGANNLLIWRACRRR